MITSTSRNLCSNIDLLFAQYFLQKHQNTNKEKDLHYYDNITPIYHNKMVMLPKKQRKFLWILASFRREASAKDVARIAHVHSTMASAVLHRLTEKKLVTKMVVNKRNSLYRIADNDFEIWINIRRLGIKGLEKRNAGND